jgi:hypothetical protein
MYYIQEVENMTEDSYKEELKPPQLKNDENEDEEESDQETRTRKDSNQGIEDSDFESLRWYFVA